MKPRLLVIELHHLGDAILALPFLRAASQRYDVSVFCTRGVADMLRTFAPYLQILEAANRWPARLIQASTTLRKIGFAASVCAWSDTRCHLLASLANVPVRFGFPANEINFYGVHLGWRRRRLHLGQFFEKAASFCRLPLLTNLLNRRHASDPHFQNWWILAKELSLEVSYEAPWIEQLPIPLPDPTATFVAKQKQSGQKLWLLHAGGRLATKRWPIERFETLLRDFFAPRHIPVLIIQAPGESAPHPQHESQLIVPSTSHAELASLLGVGDFLLANDSYPAHLAAALGKQVFTIFGSGNPDWFAPFANANYVTRSSICPYHPCIDRCKMSSVICLEDIQPEDVTQTIRRNVTLF